jgi:alkaline phosphatase
VIRLSIACILVSVSLVFLPALTNGVTITNTHIAPTPTLQLRAKNVIVMISDGCGYNHVQATSMYQYGATGTQAYDEFPVRLAMTTYSSEGRGYEPSLAWRDFGYVLSGATDSAAAATTISSGTKTYDEAVGVDVDRQPLQHIMEYAEAQGKATGVITSVPLSHATPAGFVAHNISRWNYEGIAQEMLLVSAVDVIMGAGHPYYDGDGQPIASPTYRYVGGENTWNRVVAGTAGEDADGDGTFDAWTLIETKDQFRSMASGETPRRVCGIAQVGSTLQQARRGNGWAEPYAIPLNQSVPDLAEMTRAGLNVLDNDPDGLVLMVEGGAVDWASHANQTGRMIEEQIDFNRAVEAVVAWVETSSNWCDTLLIVTADHETGYLMGPGSNPQWKPLIGHGVGAMPDLEWHSRDHTNQLVPFYAKGGPATAFGQAATLSDAVRGFYIDNSNIAPIILQWLDTRTGESCVQ